MCMSANTKEHSNGSASIREVHELLKDVHQNVHDLRTEMKASDEVIRTELVAQANTVRQELSAHYKDDEAKFRKVFVHIGQVKMLGTVGFILLGLLGIGIRIVQ